MIDQLRIDIFDYLKAVHNREGNVEILRSRRVEQVAPPEEGNEGSEGVVVSADRSAGMSRATDCSVKATSLLEDPAKMRELTQCK